MAEERDPAAERPTPPPAGERAKSAGQVVAIVAFVAYLVLLLQKGSVDIAAIQAANPDGEFWRALGRHLLRVLGGG